MKSNNSSSKGPTVMSTLSSTTKAFALAIVALLVATMYKPQSLDFVVASGASLAASSAQEAAQNASAEDRPQTMRKPRETIGAIFVVRALDVQFP